MFQWLFTIQNFWPSDLGQNVSISTMKLGFEPHHGRSGDFLTISSFEENVNWQCRWEVHENSKKYIVNLYTQKSTATAPQEKVVVYLTIADLSRMIAACGTGRLQPGKLNFADETVRLLTLDKLPSHSHRGFR